MCRLATAATIRASEAVDPPIPATQLRALTLLADAAEQTLTVGALADGIGTTISSASRICQRLARSALVDRPRVPGTERPVRLTDRGTALLAEVNALRLTDLREAFANLPARTRAELARAVRGGPAASRG